MLIFPRAVDIHFTVAAIAQNKGVHSQEISHAVRCVIGLSLFPGASGNNILLTVGVNHADLSQKIIKIGIAYLGNIRKRVTAPAVTGALRVRSAAGKLLTVGQDFQLIIIPGFNYRFAEIIRQIRNPDQCGPACTAAGAHRNIIPLNFCGKQIPYSFRCCRRVAVAVQCDNSIKSRSYAKTVIRI